MGDHVLVQDQLGDLRVAVRLTGEAEVDNYVKAWTTAGIGELFLNSVIVVSVALCDDGPRGDERVRSGPLHLPGQPPLYYLMFAGLTFPVFLAMVPLFFVLREMGLLNTLPGLILIYVGFAFRSRSSSCSPSSGRCRSDR